MSRERVLMEVHVRVEYVGRYAQHDLREHERAAEDFVRAISNHRDLANYRATVEREYEERCSFCGMTWETWDAPPVPEDGLVPGIPVCCEAAQIEFAEVSA